METKILIAMPCNRGVKPKTAECLAEMISNTKLPVKTVIATEGYTIAENRAYLVYKAIENGCSHILFIDDDMVFPVDTLDRLIDIGKYVVGVNSHGRKLPIKTTVTFLEKDWTEDENGMPKLPEVPEALFECKEVGGGVLLVDMSVFEKIDKPWFGFDQDNSGWVKQGEDGWFCQRCREKDIKIYCDPTLAIGHIGDYIY